MRPSGAAELEENDVTYLTLGLVKVLEEAVEDQTTSLPLLIVELARVFLDQIEGLSKTISRLER
jgi:hypothetical protein